MTCEQVNDELSAYLDGELPADARAAVESHLAGCVECKQAAEELKSIAAAIHDLPRHKAPATLVATVHERVQKSPAPLLLIDTAPPINASGEVLKPRSMWGPVAFGIAAVLMLFALAFAVMPAISNNGDSTAMRDKDRRSAYESDRSDRGDVASAATPAETAKTAAPTAEKRADFKADRDTSFGAAPAPVAENKLNALAEGGAPRDKGQAEIADGKPELFEKAGENRARKAALGTEIRKLEAPVAAVTPVPPAATQGANANGVPVVRAERDALTLQQEKQADEKNQRRAADAVPLEEATLSKKQPEFGERSGGARRLSAKDPQAAPAPGAPSQAPGNAAPAPVVVPATPPPAPAPKPTAPTPFAAAPKTEALAKAAPQEPTAGQDKATGDIKKKSAPVADGKERAAAENNQAKEAELRRNDDAPTANRGALQPEQEQGGKGATRGAAQPTGSALAGGKPGAGAAQTPPPPAKRATPGEAALDGDDIPRKDGRNTERLKSMKDEAEQQRVGGIGGGEGGGGGLTRNGIKPALTFRTRDPQSLRAQMANLALQHGGTLVSQGAGTADLVAHIPAPQRDAFIKKLTELQAQPVPEAAKTATASEAKREASAAVEPAKPVAKQKADEKADTAEVTFRVVIESILPAAAPADAAKQPNE